jgi:hypothetical protein
MRTYLLAPKRNVGRMACLTVSIAALLSCALPQLAGAAGLSSSPDSGPAVHHDTSPPLLSLRPSGTPGQAYPVRPTPPLPSAASRTAARDTSGAQAASPFTAPLASPLMPSTSANFNGIGENACNCVPSDPSGAAGPSQYVEVANTDLAVYSKTGTALLGPEATNTLWSGFGGGCETNNNGDGTVLFDTLSQRWVVQQFSVSTTPYLDCVAVSETSDATGKWHRYSFQYEKFPDYPKMGVWPDAYYASFNLFSGNTFAGAEACAFNRAKMLNGEAASQQCFVGTEKGGASLLPATLDGTTQPPSGEPEWFVALSPTEAKALAYWKFHVDWSNPANTTFTGPTNLPVEAFSEACGGGACIPQAETSNQLDSLGDRLMFRLAYRNFGGHESMVVAHSVTAGSSVGMRWYELRPSSGSLTVYQQGTYAPDSVYRWMGSIAMDKSGDMALGYSVSSSSLHPQIRYTGRLVGDPSGTMPQGEATLYEGTGSQTSYVRWGDYTEMSVDPSDDCTFWYVNEYEPSNGSFNWHTRIGSFKFPSCGGPTATTELATGVTKTEATLNGTVNPNGQETKYYFEYGTSTSYGTKTVEASAGSGTGNIKESQAVTGLSPGTEYHFRIVATNAGGTTYGADKTFTTALWLIQSTPNQIGLAKSVMSHVSCASSTSCVAVGYYVDSTNSYNAQAETWNGTEWSIHNPSIPTGSTLSTVQNVSCISSSFCIGVGHYVNSSGTTVTLAEKWNGTEWAIQSSPNPSGASSSYLWGVSCSSSTACAAVGEYTNSSGVKVPLAERWNGTEWSIQTIPNPSGSTATSLQNVSCPTSSMCMAAGYYSDSSGWHLLAERWNGTEWSIQSTITPGGSAYAFLQGVSCTSATECVVVGYYYSTSAGVYATFPEKWNGSEWSIQGMTNPSGAKGSYLRQVSCTSSTACTAVGEYVNSTGTTQTLAQRWNGTEWNLQTPPNPSGAQESVLNGVSCTSSTECKAIGWYKNEKGITTHLAQKWNGTEWLVQSAPGQVGLAKSVMSHVSCSGSTSCMAVGYYVNSSGGYGAQAETWSGTEWAIHNPSVPTGATLSTVQNVSCTSSTFCVGVGHFVNSSGTTVTLAEKWNGTEWSIQSSPNPSEARASFLWGVSCSSSTACTAVGEYTNSSGVNVPLAERWNGTEWVIQTTPNPSGSTATSLQNVSCPTASTCMAVGYYNDSSGWHQLAERWNGTEWSIQSTVTPGGSAYAFFQGVSCTSATECTAVGYYYAASAGVYATFPEKWNGSEWSVEGMTNPSGAKGSYLRQVSCTSSTACTAVGEYVNSSGTTVTLAQRWNGTEWKLQTPPNPSGAQESVLNGVSCTSSTECKAIGWYINEKGITTNLAEG